MVAVASFQRLVIPYLTSQYTDIKRIIYFSDGISAQYKNKKNLNLCHYKDDFNLNAECHFLPPSTTKNGLCYAIRGTIKMSAYKTSLQLPYKDHIISLLDLLHYWTGNFKNIKFFFAFEEYVAKTSIAFLISVARMRISLKLYL